MQQIEKNTVESTNQINDTDKVHFYLPEKEMDLKILFIGNSITLHAVKPEIGWDHFCGMAASSEENDYVHLLMKIIRKHYPNAGFCIVQVADYERNCCTGKNDLEMYKQAKDFDADILIARFVENVPTNNFNAQVFKDSYVALINYLSNYKKKRVVFTTGFWKHSLGDPIIREIAHDFAMPLVELGDLGEEDSMKAIGLFQHSGVANHPGNLGMKNIADRILTALEKML